MKKSSSPVSANYYLGKHRLLLVLALMMVMGNSVAQQCLGTGTLATGGFASMFSSGSSGPLHNFIGMALNCTTVMYGPNPPVFCAVQNNSSLAQLAATFASPASSMPSNGCSFMCPGGTCQVRGGDALPVELMEFSVSVTNEGSKQKPQDIPAGL